jgi:6-pyruvoyltetrahydropterin/6-carboxytetrahydropterin synthase
MYYVLTMFKARVLATFSAAHSLRGYRGDCERLHGHNYRVEAVVASESLDGTGMVMDFSELKGLLGGILEGLDHRLLNELAPFRDSNPSAENIARHIFGAMTGALAPGVSLVEVTVWENDTCSVTCTS